jgi:hypothetical protein
VEAVVGARVHPSVGDATAWQRDGTPAICIDDSQLKIVVERRSRYCLPHAAFMPVTSAGEG